MICKTTLKRYPFTEDKSLQAWNAADEYIIRYLEENQINAQRALIYNDRFGYLTCCLNKYSPQVVIGFKSQERAITINLNENKLEPVTFIYPLSKKVESTEVALVKIPKSVELFRLFLSQIHTSLKDTGIVVCGFMTKYFSPQFITVAQEYFEVVEQTKAHKKSRLIVLQKKKKVTAPELVNTLMYKGETFKQYWGVFSSSTIDYATQFLIEHLVVKPTDEKVLDLASGNGVIACAIRKLNPRSTIHLVDDFYLAIESSKLNLQEGENYFHFNDTLEEIEDDSLDLVVSNPPFHFDFETNIEISFSLFEQVFRKLKHQGNFQLVANRHLPYKPFLNKTFGNAKIIEQNSKFIIYQCVKP